MSPSRIYAILDKDLRDGSRDGRVALLVLLPIMFAVLFKFTTPTEGELPSVTVAVAAEDREAVGEALKRSAERTAELTIVDADDRAAVERRIDADDADIGVVVEPVDDGAVPRATVLVPDGVGSSARAVVSLVGDAVGAAAGREPPSRVDIRPYEVDASQLKPSDVLDRITITVGALIATVAALIALVAVPIQTAEELETGTFGALRLAASGTEILVAKVLAGMLYALFGVVATVVIMGVDIDNLAMFWGAALGLNLSLIFFGVLMGLLSRNATAINTYGSFLLFPAIAATVGVLAVTSGPLAVVLDVLPFGQAAKLMFDGLSPDKPFDAGLVSWLVLAAWTVLGYGLLARIATRREV